MPRSRSLILLLLLCSPAAAFDTVINLPPGPLGPIGSNTQVNLLEGGVLDGLTYIGDPTNVEINLLGGTLTGPIDARPADRIEISGGSTDLSFAVVRLAPVAVLTGGSYREVRSTGQVTLTGGRFETLGVENPSMVPGGARLVMQGGSVGTVGLFASDASISAGLVETLDVNSGSSAVITGGHIRSLTYRGPTEVHGGRLGKLADALGPSDGLTLYGQFALDGVPVSGQMLLPEGALLSGVLQDGTPLAFSSRLGDDLEWSRDTLSVVPTAVSPVVPGVINAPFDPIPSGLSEGQTLNLGPGADTGPDFVSQGGVINVVGGTLGDDAVAIGGSALLSSGSIGSNFAAIDGAAVVVSGGRVGPGGSNPLSNTSGVLRGSFLFVVGGEIPGRVDVDEGSSLDAVGGSIGAIRPLGGSSIRVGGDSAIGQIDNQHADIGANLARLIVDGGEIASVALRQTELQASRGKVGNLSLTEGSYGAIQGGEFDYVSAGSDSTVQISGGVVAFAFASQSSDPSRPSLAHLIFGTVDQLGAIGDGNQVVMDGGEVVDNLIVNAGHAVINGGRVQNADTLEHSQPPNGVSELGRLEQTGGQIRSGIAVHGKNSGTEGAVFDAFGGVIGRRNLVTAGATMRLHGGEFMLNGQPVSGDIDLPEEYLLTGTLMDGSVVVLSSATDDRIADGTLELASAPVPPLASVFNAPDDGTPRGLRAGQTLSMENGVDLGYNFSAVDATLEITGGSIGYGFELVRSNARLAGGVVGNYALLHHGSTLSVEGASVGEELTALAGATVELSAGRIGYGADFRAGSTFYMSGGETSNGTKIAGDATISGGTIASFLTLSTNANLQIVGGDYYLDGVSVSGEVVVPNGSLLTGVLQDGTPFLIGSADLFQGATVSLVEVQLPDVSPVSVPLPDDMPPRGVRSGQSMLLNPGVSTSDYFTVVDGELRIQGGSVGVSLEAIDSRIDLLSGSIGRPRDILAGGSIATFYEGTVAVIQGGTLYEDASVHAGATLTQLGGEVRELRLDSGSVLNVAGGVFLGQPTTLIGRDLWAPGGSEINLYGLTFVQEGVDLLAGLEMGESIGVSNKNLALVGVLADGSEIELVPGGRRRIIGNGDFTLTKLLQGDFNGDGLVDAADYSVWRDSEGLDVEPGSGADHDFDGRITRSDYEVWASNFGLSAADLLAGSAAASVPEPAAMAVAILAAICSSLLGRRFRI